MDETKSNSLDALGNLSDYLYNWEDKPHLNLRILISHGEMVRVQGGKGNV